MSCRNGSSAELVCLELIFFGIVHVLLTCDTCLNIVSSWSDFTVSSIQSKSSLANLITRRHPIERKANTCSRRYARENQCEKDTAFDWLTTWRESDVRFLENRSVTEAVTTLKNYMYSVFFKDVRSLFRKL